MGRSLALAPLVALGLAVTGCSWLVGVSGDVQLAGDAATDGGRDGTDAGGDGTAVGADGADGAYLDGSDASDAYDAADASLKNDARD